MLWKNRRQSSNIQDRRGISPGGIAVGGGVGTLVLLLIGMFLGVDPSQLVQQLPQGGGVPGGQEVPTGAPGADADEGSQFVSVVLADTEDVWNSVFATMNRDYEEPILVLFSGQVSSACGYASAAVGPFYCPADNHVYLDLTFFDELHQRFGAPGDFAQAYVIAHEVGHHVQNQLGIARQVESMRGRVSQEEMNELSVRMELQADFLAGVWAHHAQHEMGSLEAGDVEEAMAAANAIGDDRLQKQTQGYVVPDSFTHGTSEQRVRWFMKGYKSGDINQGDTFNIPASQL